MASNTLDRKEAYQKFEKLGLNYGPTFKTIVDGSFNENQFVGHVQQTSQEHGRQHAIPYVIHPRDA